MSRTGKSVAVAGSSFAISKFVQGYSNTSAAVNGAINGLSVYMVDTFAQLLAPIRSSMSFLGQYAEDGFSALVSTLIFGFYVSYQSGASLSDIFTDFMSLIKAYLYNLGANVLGTYGAPAVSGLIGM